MRAHVANVGGIVLQQKGREEAREAGRRLKELIKDEVRILVRSLYFGFVRFILMRGSCY